MIKRWHMQLAVTNTDIKLSILLRNEHMHPTRETLRQLD
jgi:hypothetical protein